MSEETAVIEKPVRPEKEGRRKRTSSGGGTGGGRPGRRGRESGPALGDLRSMGGLNHPSIQTGNYLVISWNRDPVRRN